MDEFSPLGTMIGQYRSALQTLTNLDYSHVALDSNSRLIVDHTTASVKIGDGTNVLDVIVEDAAHVSGSKGLMPLVVRQDTLATLVSADGDMSPLSVNAAGALYVTMEQSRLEHAEDSAHVSGHYGTMSLAVRKDAEGTLVDTDGDYAPLQVNSKGQLRTVAEMDLTFGTEADVGSDESGDGIVSITNAWTDIVTIPVADTTTLAIGEVDGTGQEQCSFRLVTWDASQLEGAEVVKVHRVFMVTENVPTQSLNFNRIIEVLGSGTDISVKLQAKARRSTTSKASGGINAYVI